MQRKIQFSEGEFYHVYNRGVEKREIFSDNNDRERFLRLLYIANSTESFVFRDIEDKKLHEIDRKKPLIAIGAYCLMPNHFHALVKEIEPGGTSKFMAKTATGYSMYYNKKNNRVGALFQGTFQAQHITRDEHLRYLYAYIHLNPIKASDPRWKEGSVQDTIRAQQFLHMYRYSSYLDYCGVDREEKAILSQEEFPEYFTQPHSFEELMHDFLEYRLLNQENKDKNDNT